MSLSPEDIPPSEERRYITVNDDGYGRKYFQLKVPPSDEKRAMYIKGSTDLELLKRIRDEIISNQYTREEILLHKPEWKKPAKEPTIEKYIRRTSNGRYGVRKKKKSFGVYATLEEARNIRDKLLAHNWNEEEVPEVQVQRRNRLGEDRYIFKEKGGKYSIKRMKKIGNKVKTYRYEGSIPTLEEARRLRDEWESIDWDWDRIDLI